MRDKIFSFPSNQKTRAGFSLVEILLVVVLLAIMAGVALPHFGTSYRSILHKKCVDNISSLMRYAQSRAIIKRTPVEFILLPDQGTYSLRQIPGETENPSENFSGRINGPWGRTFNIPKDVEVTAPDPVVRFYPGGAIDKTRMKFCLKDKCLTVSTRDRHGRILVYDSP